MTHPKSQPDTNDARAALEQIAVVCTDNMDRSCDHRMALDFVRQVANDYLDRAAPRCGVQTVQATRRQIAEAIADGWTNGNETYEAQNDIMRMRLDHAALAVLDLLASSPLPSADGGRDDG